MKPIEQLTYRGQARRIRGIAVRALDQAHVSCDRLSLIFHGENTTFRARHPSGDHLVRVHRPGYQNRRTIASELEFLRALSAATDLVVPRPVGEVKRLDAAGVAARDVVIFRWIHGRFSPLFTEFTMARVGRVLGELHAFARSFEPSARFERRFITMDDVLAGPRTIDRWPARSRPTIEGYVERALDVCDELGRGHDVWGLLHADLHHGNRLVCPGGVLAPIDFDDLGFGHYLHDFAVILGFPWAKYREDYPALLTAFLAGYREKQPIEPAHLELLPAFMAMRIIGTTLWLLGRAVDNPYFAHRAPNEVSRALEMLSDLDRQW